MRNVKIIYLDDLNDDKLLANNLGIYELIPVLDKYYKLKKTSLMDIKDGKCINNDNLCIEIAPDDTVTQKIYEDKIHILKCVTSETTLYEKNDNVKKRKSYGKYIIKTVTGEIKIVDSYLSENLLNSEFPFEYVDIESGKKYLEKEIEIGYPVKNLTNIEVLRSEFIASNKKLLFELLKVSYENQHQRKKDKTKVIKKIIKGVSKNND